MNNRSNNEEASLSFLVVDDDHTNRLILETMLKNLGHSVHSATNGQEAIESYDRNKQDMILMDVMMPVMDGYEACRTIKSNNSNEFIPIIFITAISDDKSLSKCIECGGDDFLTKPFNNIILKAKISALSRTNMLYRIINQKNEEMRIIHSRLQHEHELAEKIFSKISTPPSTESEAIKYILSPQSISSGDILMYLDSNGHQYAMLGDFTGHGLSAAIGAIPTTDIFYKLARRNYKIDVIAMEISQKLYEVLPTGLYCAACIVDIDNNDGTISILNAGLPDALLLLNNESNLVYFKSTNLPLGITEHTNNGFETTTTKITDDGLLYIYSDGVTEATNTDNVMLGQENLEEFILSSRGSESFEQLTSKLEGFRGSDQQDDDITISEILIKMPSNSARRNNSSFSSSWNIDLHFDNEALKKDKPTNVIIDTISQHIDSTNITHNNNLLTIISELLNNEIDHGILNIESHIKDKTNGFEEYRKERNRRLEKIEDQFIDITISITTSNMGNTLTALLSSSSINNYPDINDIVVDPLKPYGRGLFLLKQLCESFSFNNDNKTVSLVYKW